MDNSDIDEYSLGLEEQFEFSLGEANYDFSKNSYVPFDYRINVEDLYDNFIKDWSMKEDYDDYIIQNINPSDFYKILQLDPFATPNENDIKRIESWKDQWCNESESLSKDRINGYTREEKIKNALSCLAVKLTMENQCKAFTEKYKTVTWKELTIIIKEKTSDKKVTIFELEQIYQVANTKGLFCPSLIEETKEKIDEIIKEEDARIISVQESLEDYYNIQVKKSKFNELNTDDNIDRLFTFYNMLYAKNYYLETGKRYQDEKLLKDKFPAMLEEMNIHLLDKIEAFTNNVFSDFVSTHNIKEPISQDDLLRLHAEAINYGLSQSEWDDFVENKDIVTSQDISEPKEKETYKPNTYVLNATIKEKKSDELPNEQKKKSKGGRVVLSLFAITAVLVSGFFILKKSNPELVNTAINKIATIFSITDNKVASKEIDTNYVDDINGDSISIQEQCIESTKQCIYKNMSKYEIYDELRTNGSYSDEDISNAIGSINPSFKNAAKVKAELYIKKGDFSKNHIYNALLNTNKFTEEETQYAIENAEVDWEEVAARKAQSLFDEGIETKADLIATLENDFKYEHDEAKQAIYLINVNWIKVATKQAQELLKKYDNRDDIYQVLINRGFSNTEANNGLSIVDTYFEVLEKANYRINKKGEGRELVANNLIKYNGCSYDEVDFVLDNIDWKKAASEQVSKLKKKKKSDDYIMKYLVNTKMFTEEEVSFGLQSYK